MKTIIKNNIKFIIVVLVCIFSSILVTYATGSYLFNSSDVEYNNTNSGLDSTNVSDAIDELYFHATDYNEIKTTIGNSTLTTTSQTLTGAINEVNGNLGLPSSASGVSGADAFSKINTLNSKIKIQNTQPIPYYYGIVLKSAMNAYIAFFPCDNITLNKITPNVNKVVYFGIDGGVNLTSTVSAVMKAINGVAIVSTSDISPYLDYDALLQYTLDT